MVLSKGDLESIRKLLHEEARSIFNEEYLRSVSDNIIKSVSEKYDLVIKQQKAEIDMLQKKLDDIYEWKSQIELQMDAAEQFSRGLNLRVFGVGMVENEDVHQVVLDLFKSKLKIAPLSKSDIEKCHRVPSKSQDVESPRPPSILVRFTGDKIRALVLKNRTKLKGTGIHIQEDLTRRRLHLFETAVNKFSKKQVWCSNGVVLVKSKNNVVHRIETEKDLRNIK